MKIAFIGYNVIGKHVKSILEKKYSNIEYFYFDDIMYKEQVKNSRPFVDYEKFFNNSFSFIVTLGYKHLLLRRKIIQNLIKQKEDILNVIDDSVIIADDATIGEGVIFYAGTVIGNNVEISDGVILHNSNVVSHDTIIGESTYVSPSVTICGNVYIDNCCFIGANSSISNDIKIENECIIGIGSVITTNLKSKTSAIGNPFKVLNHKINLI